MTFFETIPNSKRRTMEEIADSLLSTDHEAVTARKRKHFKQAIIKCLGQSGFSNDLAEDIVKETFDEGLVN